MRDSSWPGREKQNLGGRVIFHAGTEVVTAEPSRSVRCASTTTEYDCQIAAPSYGHRELYLGAGTP